MMVVIGFLLWMWQLTSIKFGFWFGILEICTPYHLSLKLSRNYTKLLPKQIAFHLSM